MNGGLWLALSHSCQRRPVGPTSASAGKPLIFNPGFVGFVSFVALGVVRRRRSEKRRVVVPSCRRFLREAPSGNRLSLKLIDS
jgi:MYXO-CTERM domain-containing protein